MDGQTDRQTLHDSIAHACTASQSRNCLNTLSCYARWNSYHGNIRDQFLLPSVHCFHSVDTTFSLAKILLQQSPKKISLKTSNEWKSNFMQVWFNVPLNTLYRVAQIKIPHRTKCNFSTTVRFVHPNFLVYIGEILLQLWNFKKIILVFSKVMAVYIFYAIFSILHGIIDSNLWFSLSRNIDCYYKY